MVRRGQLAFDPVAVGRAECDAWAAYYRRDWPRMFLAGVGMVRHGFRLGPVQNVMAAWRVMLANRAWAPFPVNDAVKARRHMARFYAMADRAGRISVDPDTAARLEVGWWQAHRAHQHDLTVDRDLLVSSLVLLYAYVYAAEAGRRAPCCRVAGRRDGAVRPVGGPRLPAGRPASAAPYAWRSWPRSPPSGRPTTGQSTAGERTAGEPLPGGQHRGHVGDTWSAWETPGTSGRHLGRSDNTWVEATTHTRPVPSVRGLDWSARTPCIHLEETLVTAVPLSLSLRRCSCPFSRCPCRARGQRPRPRTTGPRDPPAVDGLAASGVHDPSGESTRAGPVPAVAVPAVPDPGRAPPSAGGRPRRR